MKLRRFIWFLALLPVLGSESESPLSSVPAFKVLVFSKTTMFRHSSIPDGISAIRKLGRENDFAVDATEDAGAFTDTRLAPYKAVVFLNTSGDILNEEQQGAFQKYLEHGGGLAAIHAAVAGAVATEGEWPWYREVCAAQFTNHSAVVQATIRIEDRSNASTAHLPQPWVRTDEWYNFAPSPRGQVRVLASLDEATYKGGTMGADHPIAWCRAVGKGRFWYTALGHTEASYSEPNFLRHLLGGIQIAAGVRSADLAASAGTQ